MGANFIPTRDASLVTWANTFGTQISATPTAFGLVAAQATEFMTLNTAFVTAYNVIKNNTTRSPANIITKNAAKAALIANIRLLAGIIQKYPAVTNTQRSELGLTVKAKPSPIPAPTKRPSMDIASVSVRTMVVNIHNGPANKHGKPAGAVGAKVYTFVGATYPSDPTLWTYQGDATKSKYSITFPDSVANGAQVWACAAWYNRKSQTGPVSVPATTNIQGSGAGATSATMKIAA